MQIPNHKIKAAPPLLPSPLEGFPTNSTFQKGFTLIEIIVVIVILCIVSGITIKFLVDSMRVYTMTVNQKMLFDEGKLALERMCRDIRDARAITSPAAPFPTSDSSITFTRTNATFGDVIDENIIYRLTGSTLEKVKGGLGYGIASNVSAFTVTRTTADDDIQIELTLDLASGENIALRTRVYPKNLSEDLGVPPTYNNFRIQDSSGNYASWQEVLSP
jgi:prepilin-type N-terminal cleavage/methylation domain-containing protein